MKKIITILFISFCSTAIYAQTASSSATQTTNLNLSDAIEIAFTSTGSSTGSVVNLAFSTVNDYANGVESSTQQIRIRSNKKFDVEVEASNDYFTYSGTATSGTSMKVKDVLDMRITSNNTGGQINSGYHQYKHIDGDHDKRILNDCDRGGNQTFSIQYRATPGFEFPAGTYTTNIIFTATQD